MPGNETLIKDIHAFFIEQKWTLSVAESCTGGNLAASLTRLPGCSHYFLGSIVAYSNSLKEKLLSVDPQILKQEGAVSYQVACQMAKGMLQLAGSEYALAITGIAGPGGGTENKPVGTVYGAVASQEKEVVGWGWQLEGSRGEIIEKSIESLLSELWRLIKTEKRFMKDRSIILRD